MSDTLFSHVLSEDKTRLKISWHESTREYTADEVARLVIFFANLRADMSPTVPDESRSEKVIAACDRFEVHTHPTNGTAQIALRLPGFGWPFIQFSKEQCAEVIETLRPTEAPDDAPRH